MLLKPENKDKLVAILTYHVVSGKVMAKTAVTLDKATALNKKDIALAVKRQGAHSEWFRQGGQSRHRVLKRGHSRHRHRDPSSFQVTSILLPPTPSSREGIRGRHFPSLT